MVVREMSLNLSLLILQIVLVGLTVANAHSHGHSSNKQPHILFLMVDDFGWASASFHHHHELSLPEVVTPHIDHLVAEGIELDQHYAFSCCSPSRSSFISGRLPIHVNSENSPPTKYNPDDPISGFSGIPRNMTGIAEKLKQAGYSTHMVGKWDAGMATPDHTPLGRGFQSFYGYFTHSNDYYTKETLHLDFTYNSKTFRGIDFWEDDHPAKVHKDEYEEDLFKERVIKIINNHDPDVPLFLYYAMRIAHTPLQVPQKYVKKFSFIADEKQRDLSATLLYMDDRIGDIVKKLKHHNMWDNLLLVLSSDNGGPAIGIANFPLKGGKNSDWQGGIRTNAFVAGGFLPQQMKGRKIDGYIHLADWYATFCALAGVDAADERAEKAKLPPVDSINMWPLLSGQESISPRVDVPVSYYTLISGQFKIITGIVYKNNWYGPLFYHPKNEPVPDILDYTDCGSGCLFNIINDPGELEDLATKFPLILEKMQKKLAKYQATFFNPDHGNIFSGAGELFFTKYGKHIGPFLP